jgi:hypothetical protein
MLIIVLVLFLVYLGSSMVDARSPPSGLGLFPLSAMPLSAPAPVKAVSGNDTLSSVSSIKDVERKNGGNDDATHSKANSSSSSTSSSSHHRKRRPPKGMVVSFVNGIYHTQSEWQEICDELKVLFKQQEIRPFYNPSSGFWMRDALGAGYELVRRPNDLLTARMLAEHLRNALKEVGPTGRVRILFYCSSLFCDVLSYSSIAPCLHSLTPYDVTSNHHLPSLPQSSIINQSMTKQVLHLAHSGGAILTYLAAKYVFCYTCSSLCSFSCRL